VRGAARTPSRRPNRCLRFALSPVLVKMLMADSGEWKTSERLLFQGSSVYRHDMKMNVFSANPPRAPRLAPELLRLQSLTPFLT